MTMQKISCAVDIHGTLPNLKKNKGRDLPAPLNPTPDDPNQDMIIRVEVV